MDSEIRYGKSGSRFWQILAIVSTVIALALLIALIVVVTTDDDDDNDNTQTATVLASTSKTCGEGSNPNGYVIDLEDPATPGPFHDLTKYELEKLRHFLESDTDIHAAKASDASIDSSYFFMADLMMPKKQQALDFLDNGGPQPDRQARVMMFRGDLTPATVEEYKCGPLPDVTSCTLVKEAGRRNPVQFTVRPYADLEAESMDEVFGPILDKQLGHIVEESFQAKFLDCGESESETVCMTLIESPVGSGVSGNISQRRFWMGGMYHLDKAYLHPVDFGVVFQVDLPDTATWSLGEVWYNGELFTSVEEFVDAYNNSRVAKIKMSPPTGADRLYSTLKQRGTPQPPQSQRPPRLVEPDGKRYSLQGRKVEYMGWSFNFRLSATNGPFLYDIRFKGERIAYEIGVSEIAVFYTGYSPVLKTMDFVDSNELLGILSKSLIPGGDCPETATFINQTFLSEWEEEPVTYPNAMCLFEQNNGYPLRRHSGFSEWAGSFYGAMMDSVLTLRTALTVGNYDYIVDFILHQNGVLETRFMSTGYIVASPYSDRNKDYGFQIHKNLLGNIHHHIAHFKVDLDVGGTSNRYERMDIQNKKTNLTQYPNTPFYQNEFTRHVMQTEEEALYKYSFDVPKYHVVYNENNKTDLGELKAYRIQMNGMSNWLHPKDVGNEPSVTWARHQLVVTKHKDDEFLSTSCYGMFDSHNPVVKFNTFYEDNENILDQDLVFWVTMGMHHIPHTEDIPVTPTVGNHLSFFLLPYNYFPECPSMGSRDAIFVELKNPLEPSQGVKLTRYVNNTDQCTMPDIHLQEQMDETPNMVLET